MRYSPYPNGSGNETEGAEDVALISASELIGLLETSHLLRSPKNAERLLASFERAMAKKGKPQSMDELREEVGHGFVV